LPGTAVLLACDFKSFMILFHGFPTS
jgi:hypothetical protein